MLGESDYRLRPHWMSLGATAELRCEWFNSPAYGVSYPVALGLVDCTDNRDEMADRIISESVPANHSSLCETRDPGGDIRAISKSWGRIVSLKDKD